MAGIPPKYVKACVNLILAIVIVVACIYIAPKIILLLMPFILGWFLASLANPLVRFFEEKIRIKRKAGSIIVIVLVVSVICCLFYTLGQRLLREVFELIRIMPGMWQEMQVEFVAFSKKWSKVIDSLPVEVIETAENLGDMIGSRMGIMVGELSMPTADAVGSFAGNIPGIVIAVIMCLLSSYFFVTEKDYVSNILKKIIPVTWRRRCLLLKQTTIDVMVGYLKAQLKIEIWIYLLLTVGFMVLKVRYSYLIAIPIAILDLLPVLGTGTVLIPWALFEVLSGDYFFALGLFVIWAVGQLVRQIIQPKIVGDVFGMDAIPTLVLLYVGYKLAGVIGMIVAVPFGILVMAMDEAGFFDNSKRSVQILCQGFHELRRFNDEEPLEKNTMEEERKIR